MTRGAAVEVGTGGIHHGDVAGQPPAHLAGAAGEAVEPADPQGAEAGSRCPHVAIGWGVELDSPERQPAPKAEVAFHLDYDRPDERGAGNDGMSEPAARRLGETSGHEGSKRPGSG